MATEKLALKEKDDKKTVILKFVSPKMEQIYKDAVLKYGKVSLSLLMNKFKCSESAAKVIMMHFEIPT